MRYGSFAWGWRVGEGAWWFRYLLMNPGRGGCEKDSRGSPVQVWATWFPRGESPRSSIQGFPLEGLRLSAKRQSPFELELAGNSIGENFCRGDLNLDGHAITWDLRYRSTFHVTLSSKGWIGFSRTPHSDALFSGRITLDGRVFEGDPLGFGVQGHNCGYRHRNFWTWAHAYFPRPNGQASTLEALVYEMPLGLLFRRAVLWHEGPGSWEQGAQATTAPPGFRKEVGDGTTQLLWGQSADACGDGGWIEHEPYPLPLYSRWTF